jgi:predicted TIM-barrel fold metal-dependent hydrolase
VIVTVHAADSGYAKYIADWGGNQRYMGHKTSTLTEVMSVHIERPTFDMMAAMVCDGVFDRHPALRVATVELGAAWVPDLNRRLRSAYGKMPQEFKTDPVEQLREHVWVAPFYEDDVCMARDELGADRILLGSDFPHPEGLAAPSDFLPDYAGLTPEERRLALRDNLKLLSGR